MATGFESDVGRCSTRLVARSLDGMNLGVRLAGPFMPAIANRQAILDDDTADARIRCRRVKAKFGQT